MTPLVFEEDAAARRWLAARAMRVPLVALKFGSPLLTIATLAVIVRQPNLAAQPLDVLAALAVPFAAPFLLAVVYPVVRWTPQRWSIDDDGVRGQGRVGGSYPWRELARWTSAPAEGLPGHVHVAFGSAPAYRHRNVSMMVPAAEWPVLEARFRAAVAAAHPVPAPLDALRRERSRS